VCVAGTPFFGAHDLDEVARPVVPLLRASERICFGLSVDLHDDWRFPEPKMFKLLMCRVVFRGGTCAARGTSPSSRRINWL